MKLTSKGLSTAIGLAVLALSTLSAQVRPLPVIPPDSLVQTYTGRLAHTLLNHYVTHDSLNARLSAYVSQDLLNATLDGYVLHDDLNTALSGYVTTSDSRLSDSRTPKGTAGGDLVGNYPNPAIKSSVTLTGNPTVTGNLTANGNLRLKGSGNYGNKINLGDGDYVYLHEATDDNLTVKAQNIYLSPTSSVTAPTAATTDNSTKVATTAYVKNNLASYVTTSDARLSDSRTPKGTAGGDLTGSYPNPTIKSSVTLTGNPTVTGNLTANGNLTSGGTLTVNGTGESLIKGNLRLKGSSAYGNKINLGDGDYVYLHEATDDNLTVKAKNIDLAPTTSVTAPTPATSDNSTKIATTAYVKSNLSGYASNNHTHTPSNIGAPKIHATGHIIAGNSDANFSYYATGTYRMYGTTYYVIVNTIGEASVRIYTMGSYLYVKTFNASGSLADVSFRYMILTK